MEANSTETLSEIWTRVSAKRGLFDWKAAVTPPDMVDAPDFYDEGVVPLWEEYLWT